MTVRHVGALMTIVGLCLSSAAAAADVEDEPLANIAAVIPTTTPLAYPAYEWPASDVPQPKRPALLPALYVTLGAMQAWDVYSTTIALKAGANEANPIGAPFTKNVGSMIALKAASTAGTIFVTERLWRKNRVAAVVVIAAINGATAAVAMHNMRVARMPGR